MDSPNQDPALSAETSSESQPRIRQDLETLRTLSVLHIILAAAFALGILVLAVNYLFTLHYFYNDSTLKAERQGAPLSQEFKSTMLFIYLAIAGFFAGMSVANFIASKHLYQGTKYGFVKLISFLNLLLIPMGTAVGIWTLRVLGRSQVKTFFLKSN